MSKNQKTPEGEDQKMPEGDVKVRVLRDCEHGQCNDVVLIDAALAASLVGVVDADPAAVAYAESLAQ